MTNSKIGNQNSHTRQKTTTPAPRLQEEPAQSMRESAETAPKTTLDKNTIISKNSSKQQKSTNCISHDEDDPTEKHTRKITQYENNPPLNNTRDENHNTRTLTQEVMLACMYTKNIWQHQGN